MDIVQVIQNLQTERTIFYNEADLQFSLALAIMKLYPEAKIRLERAFGNSYIDILVELANKKYPIEIKYKTRELKVTVNGEDFKTRNQGAQDLGKYSFIQDLVRLESLTDKVGNLSKGYAIWVTNDASYWNPPKNQNVGYAAFSVHNGALKTGSMSWGPNINMDSLKNKEKTLCLKNDYTISWENYSTVSSSPGGQFKYSLNCVFY